MACLSRLSRLFAATLLLSVASITPHACQLRLATTTSTDNSGLLRAIIPQFERHSGCRVQVIAVGTGKALRLAENGDVDVVLVHDREAEEAFVTSRHGVNRRDVMYNDFVLVGPSSDPAAVRGGRDVLNALQKIATARSRFVSRGDDSGTDRLERKLWQQLGIKVRGEPWHVSAGLGMAEVLTMAAEMEAYTLSDRATYTTTRARSSLEILVAGDRRLFNPYGVIAVNPAKYPTANFSAAMALIDWLTSTAGQSAIRSFQPGGQPLFFVPTDP